MPYLLPANAPLGLPDDVSSLLERWRLTVPGLLTSANAKMARSGGRAVILHHMPHKGLARALTPGEAAPVAPAAPAEAAPAPAPRRRLNPLAQILLARLEAADGQWLMVEAAPIVDTLKGLGWIATRHEYGTGVECQITIHGRHALAARPCDGDAAPVPRPVLPGESNRAGRWWWESSSRECGLHRG